MLANAVEHAAAEPGHAHLPVHGGRFSAAIGILPILTTALPHLTDDPEGLYDEVEAFVAGLTPAAAVQHRRMFGGSAIASARPEIGNSGDSGEWTFPEFR